MPSTQHPGSPGPPRLSAYEGRELFTAPETMLKGLLESETDATLIAGPRREPFGSLFVLAQREGVAVLLQEHDLEIEAAPTGGRAITLALHAARAGRCGVALVPNDQLSAAGTLLADAAAEPLPNGGRLCIVLEDAPVSCPQHCPRRFARSVDLPTIEPANLSQLRDAIELGLRLSRSVATPTALIAHRRLFHSSETFEARPNRVIDSVDAMLARRRRRRRIPRLAESSDVLRMLRRLELNRATGLPSPGERTAVGFITVGPAHGALQEVVARLHLSGRVALMQLGAIHPVDDAAIGRLLARCEQVVVLEPRPGSVQRDVLMVSEMLRQRGERSATVWGERLPAPPGDEPDGLAVDETGHPSLLARRLVRQLNVLRPGRVGSHLMPKPPAVGFDVPPRGTSVGIAAARQTALRALADVNTWLGDNPAHAPEASPTRTALAIDGAPPDGTADRVVNVEIWDPVAFGSYGIAALRQTARDVRPWLFVVLDVGAEDGLDLARLIQGAIPAEGADRVVVETASFSEHAGVIERLRAAAAHDGVTVLLVRDGLPAHYDVAAVERALAEVDRLGFEPRQQVTWPAERACVLREDDPLAVAERAVRGGMALQSRVRVDRIPAGTAAGIRVRARPLLEQVEVIRSRPPARRWRRSQTTGLPLPEVIHRRAPSWRVHVAGFGGAAPGRAAEVLMRAGRVMGYAVSAVWNPQPIGLGRRAWAQVLYTRPRVGEPLPVALPLPFGEADLLLGVDGNETLRALGEDRTLCVAFAERSHGVVNSGRFRDEVGEPTRVRDDAIRHALRETTRAQPRLVEDFAGACRAWFHTDRAVDLAVLGAAFQLGLVPVTMDAIEHAIEELADQGTGRAMDAFQFGRHLAVHHHLFSRPREDREEDASHIVRRISHHLAWRARNRPVADRFRSLAEESLLAMPGLAETDPGRAALHDFVIALQRCLQWGGIEYAEHYAERITELYRRDRGDTGRALTRCAVLPLATAMLIRDPLFVATMATSGEQRRRIRQTLNVKRARADELQRRYLTRFEVFVKDRRYRLDIRTSDWPARVMMLIRRWIPFGWRGSRSERSLRSAVITLVQRAATESRLEYETFRGALLDLHERAVHDRMRGMDGREVEALLEQD